VEALVTEGFAVQLKHDDKETSWENHGFVRVIEGGDGKGRMLAESTDFQHNRFFRASAERTRDLMANIKAELAGSSTEEQASAEEEQKAPVEPAPSDSESSTKVPSDGEVA
jgi:hypothetical protein